MLSIKKVEFSIFLLSIICLPLSAAYKIPTKEEIYNLGHPLTYALYASRCNYEQSKTVPSVNKFVEFMQEHQLLQSPWIVEKGFIKDLEKLVGTPSSTKQIIDTITQNKIFSRIPQITQDLLIANLMDAYKDYMNKNK